VGKSALLKKLVDDFPPCFAFALATTSRAPGPGEVDGVDYNFCTASQFEAALEAGKFLEWGEFNGTYFGTSTDAVAGVCELLGRAALVEVDVAGAQAMYARSDLDPVCVFVSPPSLKELEARMRSRGITAPEEIAMRMRKASAEIEKAATSRIFAHYIINDDPDKAYEEFRDIALNSNRWIEPYALQAGSQASSDSAEN